MYDDIWWCMMMYDDIWWYMMMYDDIWWCMMMYDGVFWYNICNIYDIYVFKNMTYVVRIYII